MTYTKPPQTEAASCTPTFPMPEGTRAVLISIDQDGKQRITPVDNNSSVLNIERDLRDHMNAYPYPDDWLIQLRDYIDQRLAAREEARMTGGISVPTEGGAKWSAGNK
jgi:hypothetical protein